MTYCDFFSVSTEKTLELINDQFLYLHTNGSNDYIFFFGTINVDRFIKSYQ